MWMTKWRLERHFLSRGSPWMMPLGPNAGGTAGFAAEGGGAVAGVPTWMADALGGASSEKYVEAPGAIGGEKLTVPPLLPADTTEIHDVGPTSPFLRSPL